MVWCKHQLLTWWQRWKTKPPNNNSKNKNKQAAKKAKQPKALAFNEDEEDNDSGLVTPKRWMDVQGITFQKRHRPGFRFRNQSLQHEIRSGDPPQEERRQIRQTSHTQLLPLVRGIHVDRKLPPPRTVRKLLPRTSGEWTDLPNQPPVELRLPARADCAWGHSRQRHTHKLYTYVR